MCPSFCLSLCLSVCVSVHLSVCLSVRLSASPSFFVSVCLSVYRSTSARGLNDSMRVRNARKALMRWRCNEDDHTKITSQDKKTATIEAMVVHGVHGCSLVLSIQDQYWPKKQILIITRQSKAISSVGPFIYKKRCL